MSTCCAQKIKGGKVYVPAYPRPTRTTATATQEWEPTLTPEEPTPTPEEPTSTPEELTPTPKEPTPTPTTEEPTTDTPPAATPTEICTPTNE